ncbi:hypothetical protein H9W95_19090 [Flavobacterium lindanitolerans]|nr:hypothetical protein [Flavobacterium lindanitolerans]
MKRILFPFFAFFILFSCKKAEVVEQEKTVDTVNVPVVEKETPGRCLLMKLISKTILIF